jgi:Transglycosylase-like domain/Putative Flp pilus-assembly TadE/G-like
VRAWQREDGQIVPALLVLLLAGIVLGLMMLQVGLAADYKSRAQTAADAASLAGAIDVKHQIEAAWATDHQLTPEEINMGTVCAQAAQYAARNRARLVSCTHELYDVLVQVEGSDELQDVGDTGELKGDKAQAKSRATPWGMGSGGGIPGVGLPVGGGGGGDLMGADPRLKVYADVAARFGLHVSSGLRPGAITTSGNVSFHSSGDALDLSGAPADMLRFAQYAAQHWGAQLEELIHTPLGFGIKNGVRVAPYATAEHYNHVHIADTDPPAPGDDDAGPPQNGGAVPAGPSPGGLAGGGLLAVGLHVHLVRWDGQGGRGPDIPGVPPGVPDSLRQLFYNIMICESGGDPQAIEEPGGVGGPLGHYGLFQFDIPTWESVGGHGNPINAPPEEQWARAIMLYQRRGFQPWECADANHLGYV